MSVENSICPPRPVWNSLLRTKEVLSRDIGRSEKDLSRTINGRCPYQGGKSNQSNLSSFDDEELTLLITKISVIAHHTATTDICKDKAVHDVVSSDKNSSSVAMNTSLVVFRDFPDVCIIVLCPYVVVYACLVYTVHCTCHRCRNQNLVELPEHPEFTMSKNCF